MIVRKPIILPPASNPINTLTFFLPIEQKHHERGRSERRKAKHKGQFDVNLADESGKFRAENAAEGFDCVERTHHQIAVLSLAPFSRKILLQRR